jgi:hypothetical protein
VESLGMFLPILTGVQATQRMGQPFFFWVQNSTQVQKIYGKINEFFILFSKTWKKI